MNIHYIAPYSIDKNIGGAINTAVRKLNASPEDWIVHVDHDVCFLRPDSKAQIAHVLSANTEYDVLGCLTNRLSGKHQLYQGEFNDSSDMREHITIANHCHSVAYGRVIPCYLDIAACVMAFRKRTWEETNGFLENNVRFDTFFCDDVKRAGGKLGIMIGVYVFHLYRMWSDNPIWEVGHLR